VKEIFDLSNNVNRQVSGSMNIDDNGKPLYIPISDEQKNNRTNFLREMLVNLNQYVIKGEINEVISDLFQPLKQWIGQFEFDSIALCNDVHGIYISDDLFLRKVAINAVPGLKSSNTVGLLHSLFEEEPTSLYFDTILLLSKAKYLYCCSSSTLLKMCDYLISKPIIFAEGTDSDKFVKILRNLASDKALLNSYMPMIRDVIYILYEKRIVTRTDKLVGTLIREIGVAAAKFGFKKRELMAYFTQGCGLDVLKESYIKGFFS